MSNKCKDTKKLPIPTKYHVITADPEYTYDSFEEAEAIARELLNDNPKKQYNVALIVKNYQTKIENIESDFRMQVMYNKKDLKIGNKVYCKQVNDTLEVIHIDIFNGVIILGGNNKIVKKSLRNFNYGEKNVIK